MTTSDPTSTPNAASPVSGTAAAENAEHNASSSEHKEPVFVADAADGLHGALGSGDSSDAEQAAKEALIAKENEDQDVRNMKTTLLDSAELATRAASLAATAGGEMHKASESLLATFTSLKKQSVIFLIIMGSMLLLTSILFTVMSFRLQGRVSQLDSMILAVGKRVVSMDASLEMVNSASETIGEVKAKQDAINDAQARLEKNLEEIMKSSMSAPEQAAKQVDAKNQEMVKLIQGLDAKLQAQAAGVKSLSSQIQQLKGSNQNAAGLKKEVESLVRLQKERQMQQEAAAKAPPPAVPAPAPVAAPVKPREKLVQYPRISSSSPAADKP